MSEPVNIDPFAVRTGSSQLTVSADLLANSLKKHHENLASAASRWVGSSKSALDELVQRWEAQHTQHRKTIDATIANMSSAAYGFENTESRNVMGVDQVSNKL